MHTIVLLTVTMSMALATKTVVTPHGKLIRSAEKAPNKQDTHAEGEPMRDVLEEFDNNNDLDVESSASVEEPSTVVSDTNGDVNDNTKEDQDSTEDVQDSQTISNTQHSDSDTQPSPYELLINETLSNSSTNETDDPVEEADPNEPLDNATLERVKEQTMVDDEDRST